MARKPTQAGSSSIEIEQTDPQTFTLAVTFEGQRFDCGNYVNRAEAQKAAKLFVERKQAEQGSRRRLPLSGSVEAGTRAGRGRSLRTTR